MPDTKKIQLLVTALHSIIESNKPQNHSLLGGSLGLSLYYYTRFKVYNNKVDALKAVALVEEVFEELNTNNELAMGYSFCSGAAGLGYMVHLLNHAGLIAIDMDIDFGAMDEYIYDAALKDIITTNNHDYLHGAMGSVYYFLTRLPHKGIEGYITKLLDAFCSKAMYTKKGTWFKNVVVPEDVEDDINFSLSHGQSSFLLILMQASIKGIKVDKLNDLITSGLQFIKKKEQKINYAEGKYSFYPSSINANALDAPFKPSRLAWCYGDLNILSVYYNAAKYFPDKWGSTKKIEHYNSMGNQSTLRKDAVETVIMDSNFCHGSSGLVQYYKYLYSITTLSKFKTASDYWLQKTLDFIPINIKKKIYKGKECDLLDGLVGVNLTLLSALSNEELEWSKALLL